MVVFASLPPNDVPCSYSYIHGVSIPLSAFRPSMRGSKYRYSRGDACFSAPNPFSSFTVCRHIPTLLPLRSHRSISPPSSPLTGGSLSCQNQPPAAGARRRGVLREAEAAHAGGSAPAREFPEGLALPVSQLLLCRYLVVVVVVGVGVGVGVGVSHMSFIPKNADPLSPKCSSHQKMRKITHTPDEEGT